MRWAVKEGPLVALDVRVHTTRSCLVPAPACGLCESTPVTGRRLQSLPLSVPRVCNGRLETGHGVRYCQIPHALQSAVPVCPLCAEGNDGLFPGDRAGNGARLNSRRPRTARNSGDIPEKTERAEEARSINTPLRATPRHASRALRVPRLSSETLGSPIGFKGHNRSCAHLEVQTTPQGHCPTVP